MIFSDSISDLGLKGTVIAIGNFDGVHLGHQMLLEHMQAQAQKCAKKSVIISFFPPAKVFLRGGYFLSNRSEKLELLKAYKPDGIVIVPFNYDYAKLSKTSFLDDLHGLEPMQIIVGEDFRFGRRREGNINDLTKIAEQVKVFSLKKDKLGPISSTRIRELILQSKVSEAAKLLGRNYSVEGLVVKGQQRGRTIGFPTANIFLSKDKALPHGVFAISAETKYGVFAGMANLGTRPSFAETPPSIEANLFDFDDDLYNQLIKINFHSFIRDERVFSGLDDLKQQLRLDRQKARKNLGLKKI